MRGGGGEYGNREGNKKEVGLGDQEGSRGSRGGEGVAGGVGGDMAERVSMERTHGGRGTRTQGEER